MTDNGKFMVISLTFMRDDSCSESWKYSNFDELMDGCADIEYYYRERYGARVYFKDTQNSLSESERFAEVEYNFDITDEERRELVKEMRAFFKTGDTQRDEKRKPEAVIFRRVEGELLFFDRY